MSEVESAKSGFAEVPSRFASDLAIAYPEMLEKLVVVSPGMSGYEFVLA